MSRRRGSHERRTPERSGSARGIGGYIQYAVILLVVVVLLFGIVSIMKRLKNPQSAESDKTQETMKNADTEEEADNSVPLTSLTVTAPATSVRVGETMELAIQYQPADATNPKLKWSCSEDGFVSVSEDGVLTPSEDGEKSTVTVTAETTDGSNLSASFELRIYPAIDPDKPMVAITFDDGPNPDTTSVMLDALEENYAKATFFCLGQNTENYPETVQREYELGMEVGTHTYSHVQLTTLGTTELEEEITNAVDAIKDATGTAPSLMRPPYGSYDETVLSAAKSHGLCCVNWSLDTEDWKTKNADDTYAMVMTATDGDVVLLHDIHEYNVDAVKRFVPDLIEQGFQLVTVSEMYAARGETLEAGTIHYRTDPTTEETGETQAAEEGDSSTEESGTSGNYNFAEDTTESGTSSYESTESDDVSSDSAESGSSYDFSEDSGSVSGSTGSSGGYDFSTDSGETGE